MLQHAFWDLLQETSATLHQGQDENWSTLNGPEIQRRVSRIVRRVLFNLRMPDSAVDDVCQAVLIRLLALKDDPALEIRNLDAFLFTIARNEALRFREKAGDKLHVPFEEDQITPGLSDNLSELRRIESGVLLRNIWKRLSDEERDIFQLLIIGYDGKEMALRLGVKHDVARKRVSRLREKLRELLLVQRRP